MDINYEKAWEKIRGANSIAILPHKDADGDALGAAYGLKIALKNTGKKACVWCEEEEPHKLMGVMRGLCGCDKTAPSNHPVRFASTPPKEGNDACHPSKMKFDLAISIDSADLERLGRRTEFFVGLGENTIAFDHHQSFTHFADCNILESPCGACVEFVYKFLVECGMEITPDIAHNLYLGISSDTGGFRQTNTTPASMDIGAELMRRGADYGEINTSLFLSNTLNYTRILGEVLSDLKMFHNNEIAVLYADKELLGDEATEGLVNFALNIIGVKVGIFLSERVRDNGERVRDNGERYIKISARSNSDKYNVRALCERFEGGGHIRAAGGEIATCDMEKAIAEIVAAASELIESADKGRG